MQLSAFFCKCWLLAASVQIALPTVRKQSTCRQDSCLEKRTDQLNYRFGCTLFKNMSKPSYEQCSKPPIGLKHILVATCHFYERFHCPEDKAGVGFSHQNSSSGGPDHCTCEGLQCQNAEVEKRKVLGSIIPVLHAFHQL